MAQSFSELLARIPKTDRTTRAKAVLALYCVGKDRGGVASTTEVKAHLKLHLRRAMPTNVSDTLIKATPYVEVALGSDGSRGWCMTGSGVGWLTMLTGVTLDEEAVGLSLALADFHPQVGVAAETLMVDGHYGEAVGRAAKALNLMIRQKTGRLKDDGVAMMHQVFATAPTGVVRLLVNDLKDKTECDEQDGVRFLMAGVQAAIANVDKHGELGITDAARAMEVLAAISFLARIVDGARRADTPRCDRVGAASP